MKITIYELLGLGKDGKAPLNIEFKHKRYYLNYEGEYVRIDDELIYLSKEYNLLTCLDDEVVIKEEVEDKEYEDIEEIGVLKYCENEVETILHRKIDALIRNQKYILERLNNDK